MPDSKMLDYYADLLKRGRISRREFMGRAVAVGLSLPLADVAGKQGRKGRRT